MHHTHIYIYIYIKILGIHIYIYMQVYTCMYIYIYDFTYSWPWNQVVFLRLSARASASLPSEKGMNTVDRVGGFRVTNKQETVSHSQSCTVWGVGGDLVLQIPGAKST